MCIRDRVANLLMDLYERGAVRDALDEGVRAGVPAGATAGDCRARVRDVIDAIAGGSSVRIEEVSCEPDGDRVVASARISLHSWFPALVPDWRMTLRASAHRER